MMRRQWQTILLRLQPFLYGGSNELWLLRFVVGQVDRLTIYEKVETRSNERRVDSTFEECLSDREHVLLGSR